MAFHFLPLLFSLNLILMTSHAVLPPQVYWERMLPNTPMPKAIIDFLQLDKFPLYYDAKGIKSHDEIPFFYGKGIKSHDEIHFLYGKGIKSHDEFPFYHDVEGIESQDESPLWFWYGKGIKSHDEIPFFYGKGIKSHDEFPFLYGKGIKSQDEFPFHHDVKGIKSQDESPLWFWYGKGNKLQDEFPFYHDGKGIESQDESPLWFWYGKGIKSHNEISLNGAEDSESCNDANSVIKMIPVANHHQHDNPKRDIFFTEEGLSPGAIIDAHFYKRNYTTPLLPRQFAERIPFSSKMIKEILEILSLKPKSKKAENVVKTISICEAPRVNGEEKYCATSIESMVDFVTSKLEKNIRVLSTEVEKETTSTKFSVKDGVKILADDKIIACHPLNYPYVVFHCHQILNTTAYFMPLEGEDGTRVKAPAVCHQDTSEWDPNHISFKMLKMKPGTSPMCHVFPVGHLLWFSK